MKAFVLCVFIISVLVTVSSQPTYDADEHDSECASQQDLEMLHNQVILLNEKVDRVLLYNPDMTTLPSVSTSTTSKRLSEIWVVAFDS